MRAKKMDALEGEMEQLKVGQHMRFLQDDYHLIGIQGAVIRYS